MSTFIWRETVKVVTSELTRGAQLGYWRDFTDLNEANEDGDNIDLLRAADEALAVRATRALYVCRDGEWVPVDDAGTFSYDDAEYALSMPPTRDLLRDLPASLANEWVKQAQRDNEVLREYLFFLSPSLTSTTTAVEPPSGSEA